MAAGQALRGWMCHRHREQARSHRSSATVNIPPAYLARMEKQPSAVPTKSAGMLGIQRVFSHRILGLPVGSGFFNLPAVAANSAAGLGTPMCKRRKCALHNVCLRAFDVCIRYGGCARETSWSAGFRLPRVPTCVQLPPFAWNRMEQL